MKQFACAVISACLLSSSLFAFRIQDGATPPPTPNHETSTAKPCGSEKQSNLKQFFKKHNEKVKQFVATPSPENKESKLGHILKKAFWQTCKFAYNNPRLTTGGIVGLYIYHKIEQYQKKSKRNH
jgi:hypothetical protein